MSSKYHALPSSREPEAEFENISSQTTHFTTSGKRPKLLYISLICWNALLLALTIYAVNKLRYNPNQSYKETDGLGDLNCSCGSNYEEAQAMGCTFDLLSLSWLPARCRDDELTDEFAHAGPGLHGQWELWADRNASIPMSVEEVGMLAFQDHGYVYSRRGFHVAHCSFYWRKAFRMWAIGLTTEGRYSREQHIEHCHAVFMSDTPKNKGMTRSLVRLGGEYFRGSGRG